jgi:hypothetical protein
VETKVSEAKNDQRIRSGTDRGSNRGKPAHSTSRVPGRRERLLAPPGGGGSSSAGSAGAAGAFLAELARVLAAEVRSGVAQDLAELIAAQRRSALLDRRGLAEALDVSLPTVDRLTRDGAPHLRIGDSPRYEIERVVAWLRERTAP